MLCVPAPSSGLAQASHAQLSSETSIEQKEPLQHSSTVWYKQTPLAMPGGWRWRSCAPEQTQSYD